jgi:hypothetical protein
MDFHRAPVVALTCPQCGKSTAIQHRPGGGIEVALDKHLEKQRGYPRYSTTFLIGRSTPIAPLPRRSCIDAV